MCKVKGTPNYEALRKAYHVPKNARWFSVNGQYFSRDGKPPKNITGGYSTFGHRHRLGHCHPFGGGFATLGQGIGNFNLGLGGGNFNLSLGGGFNLASNFIGGGCQTILPATTSCIDPCAINTGTVCSTTTLPATTTCATPVASPVLLAGGGATASASAAAGGFGASAAASAAASGFGASASASAAASGFGASASAAASAGGFRLV